MKFVSFRNVKAIVMAKGDLFGTPIHYLLTNDDNLYQIMTLKGKVSDYLSKEGVYVNELNVSGLYLNKNGKAKTIPLTIYRRLKKNINMESVENFITENYARFEI